MYVLLCVRERMNVCVKAKEEKLQIFPREEGTEAPPQHTHPHPLQVSPDFYITLAGGEHLDQLTGPDSALADCGILEDHQLASKRKKAFGHALSSPSISHLQGTAAVVALPGPVHSFFPLILSFCLVLFFCFDIPFLLLGSFALFCCVHIQHLLSCCCCCCSCSSSSCEGGLGEMPSLRLKQRVLEAQAKVFRRRNSTSAPQPPERSSSPLTARLSLSSTASNAVESKNGHAGTSTAVQGEELSTSLDTTGSKGGTAGIEPRNGSAVAAGTPNSQSPTQPAPCPPTLFPSLEPPFASQSRGSGDQGKLLTSENLTVASPPAALAVVSPVDSALPPQPPPKEKIRPARPELQQPLPSSVQPSQSAYSRRPSQIVRKQSLLPSTEGALIRTLLDPDNTNSPVPEDQPANFHSVPVDFQLLPTPATLGSGMLSRKVWVKRPGGSPTTVNVREDDMVDDVRDVVLKKYQNALGRSYDAPDITLRIVPRHMRPRSLDHSQSHHNYNHTSPERMLSPDERLVRTLDEYFPGGQSIDEALVIDVPPLPLRKTPRPSPHTYGYGSAHDSHLGIESGEYFPPMPPVSAHSQQSIPMPTSQMVLREPSISVLTTGQVPQIPGSPGGGSNRRTPRPSNRRMQTSSPTVHSSGAVVTTGGTGVLLPRTGRSRGNSDAANPGQPPPAPSVPAPPTEDVPQKVSTPPARVASPQTTKSRVKKDKKQHASPAGLLPDGAVPPINVLIVEDNVINLRLLEAFMKRLKVRWQSAMNGKEAVDKWRAGGFHLVLMDIQLPVMNGLEATKEIRRLERINSIGFQEPSLPESEVITDEDKLPNSVLFKSPVIIVALTASSLQSDRHEALAAGCNDFLTKVSRNHSPGFFIY